ncbi:hypothetical protein MTO96_025753 [Rhipicephalus appendiculatus]
MGPVCRGGDGARTESCGTRNPVAASRTHVRHAHTRAHQLQPLSNEVGHRRRFISGERPVRRWSDTNAGRSLGRRRCCSPAPRKRAGEDAARASGRRRVTHAQRRRPREGRQQQAGTAGARRLTSGGEGAGRRAAAGEGALPAQPDPTN